MTKRKIALIGLGKISLDQHLPVIDASPGFALSAVVSRRGLGHGDVPSFETAAALHEAMPEIEAVAINTPPGVRHHLAREALEAGKDVLLEKPPTATLAELADLEAFAAKRGRVLFATWHAQFNPAVDQARMILATSGVRRLAIDWREDVRTWHPGQDWVWEPGGFGVFDPGINALSILVRLLPFPVFVEHATLTFPANRQTPIAAKLGFSSNAAQIPELSALFDWREEGGEIWRIAIETLDGRRITLDQGGATLSIDGEPSIKAPNEEYSRIYAHFADLLNKRESDVDGRPLRLVADAMMIGRRETTEPFHWS